MHLLVYILGEPKEVVYKKVVSTISTGEYVRLKSGLEECLKFDFIEIKLFSEPISFEFYKKYTLLKTNVKYSKFLNDVESFEKIDKFETHLIPFLNENTIILRIDEYLIEKYNDFFPYLNILDKKEDFIHFMGWLKGEEFNHWKLIKEGDLNWL